MEVSSAAGWEASWAWGVPLVVLTSVIHVFGLGFINERMIPVPGARRMDPRGSTFVAVTMSVAVLLATLLHAFEAAVWAGAYLMLRALPDVKTAMLYSVSALTTYGHASEVLTDRWRMRVRRLAFEKPPC